MESLSRYYVNQNQSIQPLIKDLTDDRLKDDMFQSVTEQRVYTRDAFKVLLNDLKAEGKSKIYAATILEVVDD